MADAAVAYRGARFDRRGEHVKLGQGRAGNWRGTTTGQAVLGSQKVSVIQPRRRYVDGSEVVLETWDCLAYEDLLRQVVVERNAR